MLLSFTRLDSARTTASSEALGTAPPLQLTAWLNSRLYDCAIRRVNGTASAAQPGVDASSRLGVSGRVFAVKLLCSAGSHGEPRQPSPFPPKGTRGASPKRTRRSTLPAALERRRLLTQARGLRGGSCVREWRWNACGARRWRAGASVPRRSRRTGEQERRRSRSSLSAHFCACEATCG